MPNFLDLSRCIENALDWNPYGDLKEFYGDYYSPYYAFMLFAMALPNPNYNRVAVELGVDQGRGLVSLAHGGGNGSHVYGVDHTIKDKTQIAVNMFSNITFIQADSDPPPDEIPDDIYLLHIDTEHSYSMAKAEFEAYESKLANNAIVIFDDLHAQDDSVLKYFYELPYPKIQDDRLHPQCGWGVMLYVK